MNLEDTEETFSTFSQEAYMTAQKRHSQQSMFL